MNVKLVGITLLLACQAAAAGNLPNYWVVFKDKNPEAQPQVSARTLEQRARLGLPVQQETDLPVKTAYLDSLQQRHINVNRTSRWLNAASVSLTPRQVAQLQQAGFVKELVPVQGTLAPSGTQTVISPALYARSLEQMQADAFVKAGLTGAGVQIGVIDAGFIGATTSPLLSHLFTENRVTGVRDYVNPKNTEPYTRPDSYLDYHGTEVLTKIAGYNAGAKALVGMAVNSRFVLARTDHGKNEFRGEEDYYVAALEYLDSLGVRLINTSLGYATGFDNPAENYKPADMNGSSVISRAAQLASEKKGMLIVVAAGNEGDDKNWRLISAPADARDVLSVGATASDYWTRMGYSGIGPDFLPYLKPDVACYSPNGTSFSAPAVTGFIACLLEANPKLTNKDLIRIVQESAHLYPYANNYVGYGVPQASVALQLAAGAPLPAPAAPVTVNADQYTLTVKTPEQVSRNGGVVLFHKKDERLVISEQRSVMRKGKVVVKRPAGAARTTVQAGREVIEIIWSENEQPRSGGQS